MQKDIMKQALKNSNSAKYHLLFFKPNSKFSTELIEVVDQKTEIMDGNKAAAYVSYAFSEVSFIYPISPSSSMGDYID